MAETRCGVEIWDVRLSEAGHAFPATCALPIERSVEDGQWGHVADWNAVTAGHYTDVGALASMDHGAVPREAVTHD